MVNKAQGPLAQLVERLICNEEATGSNPVRSTKFLRVIFPILKRSNIIPLPAG